MAHIDSGVTAAKRATWRDTDHRPLLRRILADNPKADEAKLRAMFLEQVMNDDDYARSCANYCFDLGMRAWKAPDEQAKEKRQAEKVKRASAVRVAVEKNKEIFKERIKHEVKTAFLQMITPNGKTLAECTGAECVEFGSGFTQIGQRVPANQKVKDILSEKQVAKLWQNATNT
jgi:hypothetical protein